MAVLICPTCQVEMRPKKTAVFVESMAVFGSYQLFLADLHECPGCSSQIIAGLGNKPVAECFQPIYATALSRAENKGRVYRYWRNENEKQQYDERTAEASL